MKIKELREKYFEAHVEFEHMVNVVAKALNIKTEKSTLGNTIMMLTGHQSFGVFPLTSARLKKQKVTRNYLAHNFTRKDVSSTMIKDCKKVYKLIKDLSKTEKIIKKWHKKTTS